MSDARIEIPYEAIADFCQRWKISEFALFGSVLRDDFKPEQSDVDVLVTHTSDACWNLFDRARMQEELSEIFGRKVDLMTRAGILNSRNQLRQKAILESARVIYAA